MTELSARFQLKLYVTGQTPRSERVIARVREIAREYLPGDCEPIVIDVLEEPQMAERDRILATPTLIRQFPLPVRRIIGDLTDRPRVLAELGLDDIPYNLHRPSH
ncbi:MAG: circadian clock protein KaiB [Acidobacteria bacterium]|nr:circadian clock protein KaiB [Acidobacteriota bacterium]